jgi:hypothetical protein
MITETNSFALDVRDAMYDILANDANFSDYTFRKTRMLPVQVALLPYLGVYIVDEMMVPDGDANAGCIRFNHTARIGFSLVHANNDPVSLERSIDATYLRIMSLLWTNVELNNVLHNNNPEGMGFEGVVRGSRRHIFGSTGANNETPFAELQYEVSCFSRSEWYPDITDALNEIDVTVAVNNVDTTQVQPITIKYMLDVLRAARRS